MGHFHTDGTSRVLNHSLALEVVQRHALAAGVDIRYRTPRRASANALMRQPGKKAWQIFDANWADQLPRMGIGLGRFYEANEMVRGRFDELAVKADTIEALAHKIGVPPSALKATVKRYNELARAGRDADFGKRPDRLTPIDTPPFCAGLLEQEFLVVIGGLNVNPRLQLLDTAGDVIPGIYLAGNTVGNRYAVDYPTMCPGLSHGMAWTTGRLSGISAAADAPDTA